MMLAERLGTALARQAAAGALLVSDIADLSDDPVAAAVLIAVTTRDAPGVILTRRTETLRAHAGQVAFPGGRIDAGEDAVAAALREAHEEVALPPASVTVLGIADAYRTGSHYHVTPDLPLVPSEAEVASVFEVPLAFLLDPANHREASGMWEGRERHFYEIVWGDRRIWGATAAIIVNLSRRLRWS